jgi:hypothetical protein
VTVCVNSGAPAQPPDFHASHQFSGTLLDGSIVDVEAANTGDPFQRAGNDAP